MRGLLFDLDGTLINSMPLHHEAWRAWFAKAGQDFDDQTFFARTAGRTNAEILADLYPRHSAADHERMADEKETLYRTKASQHLAMIDGALEFMAAAKNQGLALAVCTAAPPANIEVAFERFALKGMVQTVTSPADGLRGKPHPDIFLEAALRMRMRPQQCIVFEDAPLGVEAASRAGMKAVVLTTSLGKQAFAAYSNVVATARDFTTLNLKTILEASHA